MVSVEAAATKAFLGFSQGLIAQQKLDRIIINECHLTVTAVQYRPVMTELTMLRSLRTQFIYLTATLLPSMREEFEERNHLLRPTIVRASSNRSNLAYSVYRASKRKSSLLEQVVALARKGGIRFNDPRDKIILYAQERNKADVLTKMLGCTSYIHRRVGLPRRSRGFLGAGSHPRVGPLSWPPPHSLKGSTTRTSAWLLMLTSRIRLLRLPKSLGEPDEMGVRHIRLCSSPVLGRREMKPRRRASHYTGVRCTMPDYGKGGIDVP